MPIISQRRVVQVVATRGDALYILPPDLCDKEIVLTAVRQSLGMDLKMIGDFKKRIRLPFRIPKKKNSNYSLLEVTPVVNLDPSTLLCNQI